jgi:hypothetical protein
MEDTKWKKDETPYIIFPCSKCDQFMYAKETQKTKRCLRCGRSHTVNIIKSKGEIVKGMSKAVEIVKKRQEDFAIKKMGVPPEFRAFEDFKLILKEKERTYDIKNYNDESENNIKFKHLLMKLSHQYTRFPLYIIEIFAEEHGFKSSEIKLLIRRLLQEEFLIRTQKDYYFQLKK